MTNLKIQPKKLLSVEIAANAMEYLVGLNKKNECLIREIAEKSSNKLVKAYCDAIKLQHKKALKYITKKERDQQHVPVPVISTQQTNFLPATLPAREIA